MQLPMLPGTNTRFLLAFASATKAVHMAIRCALHASLVVTHWSVTWHSASAFCAQKSDSVVGLPPPPPPHPASRLAITATFASFRLVIAFPPVGNVGNVDRDSWSGKRRS